MVKWNLFNTTNFGEDKHVRGRSWVQECHLKALMKASFCRWQLKTTLAFKIHWSFRRPVINARTRICTGQSQSIKFFYIFVTTNHAQDRTGLARRVLGVLIFGWGPAQGQLQVQCTTSLVCLWRGFSIGGIFKISFAPLLGSSAWTGVE